MKKECEQTEESKISRFLEFINDVRLFIILLTLHIMYKIKGGDRFKGSDD